MLPAPLPPLALALPRTALGLAVAAVTLFSTWAVARFLAVGIAHHRRQAELDRRPPGEVEIEAWRWAVRRELYTRWVGPLSPRAALAGAPVAGLLGSRPVVGAEPGLHLVVGPPGAGTSATLWAALAAVLADPAKGDPVPLVLDAAPLAHIPSASASPGPLDRLAAAELVDLTGMPATVAERLAAEAMLFVDGFDDLLGSSPAAAAVLLGAVGERLGGTQGLHAVVAIARRSNGEAVPARRIVVATTPAGYEAFTRAGLAGDDGPLATVTHLEPADAVSLRAAVGAAQPPCPGLLTALDRLPGLTPLLAQPLWLDVALETFGQVPDDSDDRPGPVAGALDHLPRTAGAEEIAGALWDRWLERRLPGDPDARRHTAALARRHPPRSQPTFHVHDLGRRGTAARAWSEGMVVGTGTTVPLVTVMLAVAPAWSTVALGLLAAMGVGAFFTRVLQRHEARTARLGLVRQAEGTEDGDGPALAGLATGLLVIVVVAGAFVVAGAGFGTLPVLLSAPLLIAVPLGVAGWLAFRARFGIGGRWSALLVLGAFGGLLGALVFLSVAAFNLGNTPYPFPGDPADVMGWWMAALIVGPVVGLVDGMGVPGSGPLRLRPDLATAGFAGSLPPTVGFPVIGSVLISGPLFLGVLVQPSYAPLLAPFAAGGLAVGLAAWVVAGATAGFTPDPRATRSTHSRSAIRAELHRTLWRVLLAMVATALVSVPTGWLVGRWLSRQQLGSAQISSFGVWDPVPMVGRVLSGVAVCVVLWLAATLATMGPVRHRVVQAVAAARGRAPADYPAFLDELVAAGVLHRCGAGYRFRHPSLADHLAGLPAFPPAGAGTPHDLFDPAPPPVAV